MAYFLGIVFTLCPIIEVFNKTIPLVEILTILVFLLVFSKKGGIVSIDYFAIALLVYAFTLSFSVLVSILASAGSLNEYDAYLLRRLIVFICSYLAFKCFFSDIGGSLADGMDDVAFKFASILSIPAVFSYMQFFNILGLSGLIRALYKPFQGVLSLDDLLLVRSSSVFPGFFNATVCYTVICGFAFYILLYGHHARREKKILLFLVILNYSVQFITGRTGILFTPILLILLSFSKVNIFKSRKVLKTIFALSLLAIVLLFVFRDVFKKYPWAMELLKLFDSDERKSFGSFIDMGRMNKEFLAYLHGNMHTLLVPKHEYDLTYSGSRIYTDSFYFQEIYRYGIYGILAYFIFTFMLIRRSRKANSFVLMCTVLFAILNIKGGNVFLMDRNILFYAIIFSLIIEYDKVNASI